MIFPLQRNVCDKVFTVLQITNNAHLKSITNGNISLNQRLKISFKRHLWRTKIFETKIFKVRQKFSGYHMVQNFDGGGGGFWRFWHFPARPSIFNVSNCLARTGVLWKTVTIRQNIFRQIFEESVSGKISPRQNLCYMLYGRCKSCNTHV